MHEALTGVLRMLAAAGYRFTTVTPATHARVLRNRDRPLASDLRDVFGWSLPFEPALLSADLLAILRAADALEQCGGRLKSRLRAATLHDRLFLHSAYPTDQASAVFLGPDSYRFADFIRADLAGGETEGDVLDIGAGAGVGAIVAAHHMRAGRLVLTDINRSALTLARANAAFAGLAVETVETSDAGGIEGQFAVIVANPPFIDDGAQQLPYRNGGGPLGIEANLSFTRQGMAKLAARGRMLLYTGSAICQGVDRLRLALETMVADLGWSMTYRELDPDIFGEQLDEAPYRGVERIAAVTARIVRTD